MIPSTETARGILMRLAEIGAYATVIWAAILLTPSIPHLRIESRQFFSSVILLLQKNRIIIHRCIQSFVKCFKNTSCPVQTINGIMCEPVPEYFLSAEKIIIAE